jgi:hypothetical protein
MTTAVMSCQRVVKLSTVFISITIPGQVEKLADLYTRDRLKQLQQLGLLCFEGGVDLMDARVLYLRDT